MTPKTPAPTLVRVTKELPPGFSLAALAGTVLEFQKYPDAKATITWINNDNHPYPALVFQGTPPAA